MLNKTDVINMALQRCGAAGINLAFEDTQEAIVANGAYQRSRKFVLAQYPWNFAQKFARLARNVDAPAFGYKYAYTLPGDCLTVVGAYPYKVNDDGEIEPHKLFQHPEATWEVVGRDIYSNYPRLAIKYTSEAEMPMADEFADVLAWRMAFEMAPYLQQATNQAAAFLQQYTAALDVAITLNDAQEKPEDVPDWRASPHIRFAFRSPFERW